jgi:hypothetical protein
MSKIGFRTRKRGTPKQIGKKFPVLEKKPLPKLRVGGKTIMKVKEGDRFVAARDVPIRNTELRWRDPVGLMEKLHSGKFIVDKVIGDEVWLADADWEPTGRITFHSSKHGHIIFKKDLKKLRRWRKLRDAGSLGIMTPPSQETYRRRGTAAGVDIPVEPRKERLEEIAERTRRRMASKPERMRKKRGFV